MRTWSSVKERREGEGSERGRRRREEGGALLGNNRC